MEHKRLLGHQWAPMQADLHARLEAFHVPLSENGLTLGELVRRG